MTPQTPRTQPGAPAQANPAQTQQMGGGTLSQSQQQQAQQAGSGQQQAGQTPGTKFSDWASI